MWQENSNTTHNSNSNNNNKLQQVVTVLKYTVTSTTATVTTTVTATSAAAATNAMVPYCLISPYHSEVNFYKLLDQTFLYVRCPFCHVKCGFHGKHQTSSNNLVQDGANNVVDINATTHVTDNLVRKYNPVSTSHVYYLQHRLASRKCILSLSVRLSRCVCVSVTLVSAAKVMNCIQCSLVNYLTCLQTWRLSYLPWQVLCFRHNHRLHVTAGHFHWNVNVTSCSFHRTGHFRLMQKTKTAVMQYIISHRSVALTWCQHCNALKSCSSELNEYFLAQQ